MNLLNLFSNKPVTFNVSSVKYKKPIDQQLVDKLLGFLSKTHHHKIMVRITEEINTLIASTLLKQAVGENMIAMIFDFGTAQTENLVGICKTLKLNAYVLKRGAASQAELSSYRLHSQSEIRNFYQRFINYHLLIQADIMRAAVLDTIDKSDRLLSTRPEGFHGHFMPFYSLYKSELFELASFLKIPFDNLPTYQDLTYDKLDPVLYLLTEKQLSPEEISQKYTIDLNFLKRLKSHIDKQLFQTTISQFII